MASVNKQLKNFIACFFVINLMFSFGPKALGQDSGTEDEAAWNSAEALRAELASDIQIYATQLIDELAFSWTQSPVFETPTPVLMMNITVPYGMGSGLTVLLENHLSEILLKNPTTRIVPTHCPSCISWTIHSKPSGTVVSRGTDNPEAMLKDSPNPNVKYALYLDFEAQGSSLVLRSKITSLQKGLAIISAKSFSTSTSSAALLRDPKRLQSAADVRAEYKQILAGKDRFYFPLRAIARIYAAPTGGAASTSPFVWFEAGAETFFTQEERWGGGFSVGFTSLKGIHEGWSAGARVVRLLSGSTKSLTHPDVYFLFGGSVLNVRGENARAFQRNPSSSADIVGQIKGDEPQASFASWKIGSEIRIKNRFSAALFGEILPSAADNRIGTYIDAGAFSIRCYGLEVGFWF